jgi:hypothetical protein
MRVPLPAAKIRAATGIAEGDGATGAWGEDEDADEEDMALES